MAKRRIEIFLIAIVIGVGVIATAVLGLWMLPLGLILIAQDLPFLQGPMPGCWGGSSANGWSEKPRNAFRKGFARLFHFGLSGAKTVSISDRDAAQMAQKA